jgi:hypothetical protein
MYLGILNRKSIILILSILVFDSCINKNKEEISRIEIAQWCAYQFNFLYNLGNDNCGNSIYYNMSVDLNDTSANIIRFEYENEFLELVIKNECELIDAVIFENFSDTIIDSISLNNITIDFYSLPKYQKRKEDYSFLKDQEVKRLYECPFPFQTDDQRFIDFVFEKSKVDSVSEELIRIMRKKGYNI